MAGALTISTLNNDTGVLATQNGMTGICKAWVMFNGTGTVSIYGSFNVSSITDNGTGDYTINFTTAMPNTNYNVVGNASNTGVYSGVCAQINSTSAGGNLTSAPTTTTTRLVVSQPNIGYVDSAYVTASIFSS
jgi:hypothetical protein